MPAKTDIDRQYYYLLECYRISHGQMMELIKKRDQLLISQLLAQVFILAISRGIEIGGVNSPSALPDILVFAVPTSLILSLIYISEDGAVTSVSKYIGGLTLQNSELSSNTHAIKNFEGSQLLAEFSKRVLPYRFAAQFFSFVFAPSILAVNKLFQGSSLWEIIFTVIGLATITTMLLLAMIRKIKSINEQVQLDND